MVLDALRTAFCSVSWATPDFDASAVIQKPNERCTCLFLSILLLSFTQSKTTFWPLLHSHSLETKTTRELHNQMHTTKLNQKNLILFNTRRINHASFDYCSLIYWNFKSNWMAAGMHSCETSSKPAIPFLISFMYKCHGRKLYINASILDKDIFTKITKVVDTLDILNLRMTKDLSREIWAHRN